MPQLNKAQSAIDEKWEAVSTLCKNSKGVVELFKKGDVGPVFFVDDNGDYIDWRGTVYDDPENKLGFDIVVSRFTDVDGGVSYHASFAPAWDTQLDDLEGIYITLSESEVGSITVTQGGKQVSMIEALSVYDLKP